MAPKRKRLSLWKKGGSSVGQGAGRGADQKASDDPYDTNYTPPDVKPRPARSQNAEAFVDVHCELNIGPAVAVSIPTNKRDVKRKSSGDAPGSASGGRTGARMSTRRTPAKELESPPATSNGVTKTLFTCEISNIVDLACDPVTPVTYKDKDHVDVNAPKDSDGLTVSDCKKRIQELEVELKGKETQLENQDKSHNAVLENMKVQWEMIIQSSNERMQQLKRITEKFEVATMETSGSYADDNASPTMLGTACLSLYDALMKLAKMLTEYKPPVKGCCCCESNCQRAWQDLQQILSGISPADVPIDPNRPIQAKHSWGHWISSKFFVGFETVSFDVYDEHEKITPLNLRTQAVESFQRYLQQKDMSASDKLYVEDRRFRIFCHQKYQTIFPSDIVLQALHPQYSGKREISRDKHGRFAGDKQIFLQFVEVAKAVWLLHHLSLSFDPPASILKMGQVTLFDRRYHTPVVSDGESDDESLQHAIAFVITPALLVGKSIIKSRVYLLEG